MIATKQVISGVSNHAYTIELAKSVQEIEEALTLRYTIFFEELGREFDASKKVDWDRFDDQCHHLVVKKNSDQQIVGTYRLQTFEQASRGAGFYTGQYFNMNDLPDAVLKNGFEVGRACIHKEHRSGKVLFLLWKGFAEYLKFYEKKYLFGTLGISEPDESVAAAMYRNLEEQGCIDTNYRAGVLEKYRLEAEPASNPEQYCARERSPLLQNYLHIGCKVCSGPAYIKKMKLLYMMVLLDVETISPKIRRMFFGD